MQLVHYCKSSDVIQKVFISTRKRLFFNANDNEWVLVALKYHSWACIFLICYVKTCRTRFDINNAKYFLCQIRICTYWMCSTAKVKIFCFSHKAIIQFQKTLNMLHESCMILLCPPPILPSFWSWVAVLVLKRTPSLTSQFVLYRRKNILQV